MPALAIMIFGLQLLQTKEVSSLVPHHHAVLPWAMEFLKKKSCSSLTYYLLVGHSAETADFTCVVCVMALC